MLTVTLSTIPVGTSQKVDHLDAFERDEKDEDGQAKDKNITLYLKSQNEVEELPEKCFVQLEIAVYSWIGSVAQAPPEVLTREDS
jgi:hypothetical protein